MIKLRESINLKGMKKRFYRLERGQEITIDQALEFIENHKPMVGKKGQIVIERFSKKLEFLCNTADAEGEADPSECFVPWAVDNCDGEGVQFHNFLLFGDD